MMQSKHSSANWCYFIFMRFIFLEGPSPQYGEIPHSSRLSCPRDSHPPLCAWDQGILCNLGILCYSLIYHFVVKRCQLDLNLISYIKLAIGNTITRIVASLRRFGGWEWLSRTWGSVWLGATLQLYSWIPAPLLANSVTLGSEPPSPYLENE